MSRRHERCSSGLFSVVTNSDTVRVMTKSLYVIVPGVLPLTGTFSVIVIPQGSSLGFPMLSTDLLFAAMFWLI